MPRLTLVFFQKPVEASAPISSVDGRVLYCFVFEKKAVLVVASPTISFAEMCTLIVSTLELTQVVTNLLCVDDAGTSHIVNDEATWNDYLKTSPSLRRLYLGNQTSSVPK